MSGTGPRLVLVLGASGGCGASTLAGALALAWQRERSGAWLAEIDTRRGDLAAAWDLPGHRTLADLAGVAAEIGPQHVRAAAESHPSGLAVLVAPSTPGGDAWADADAGERLTRALATAAGPDGRCVIDAGPGLSELAWGAARAASSVLVACAPRVAAARRARALVEALASEAGPPACGLVVVAGPGRAEIGARSLERATGLVVRAELPWSPAEAAELGAGLWPRGRRRPLRTAAMGLAEACG